MILVAGPTPSFQRILVFEKIQPGAVNRAIETETLASGKGVNCARVILQLESRVTCLTLLGGETGRWMQRALRKEGLSLKVVKTTTPTRICTTLVERKNGCVTELVENAAAVERSSPRQWMTAFQSALKSCRLLVCIGTIPKGLPVSLYETMTRIAAKKGIPTIVDAQGQALVASLSAHPLLVKPNRSELAIATGCDTRTETGLGKAIKLLHRGGVQWVLVTDADKTAFLSNGKNLKRIKPPTLRVINSVGAGDSLAGGLAVALSRGKSMFDAVMLGMACGAASITGTGYGRMNCLKNQ